MDRLFKQLGGGLILLFLFFLLGACGKESPSNSSSSNSSAEEVSSSAAPALVEVPGEVVQLLADSFYFRTETGEEYAVSFASLPEGIDSDSIRRGDRITLGLAEEPREENGSLLTTIVRYSYIANPIQDRVEEILGEMTVAEKLGQLFLVRLPDDDALSLAQEYHLGGYLWFAKDFADKSPETVLAEASALQEAMPVGMIMAVDEEGGTVVRISSFSQYRDRPFASPQQVFQAGGWEGIRQDALEKANLLKSVGMNLNLAPVADVPVEPGDFIYDRSFSTDPQQVSQFVQTVVAAFQEQGVGSAVKHFPGYGNNVDTHVGVALDRRDLASFWERDFLPFQAAIEQGVEAVLISHNVMEAVDDQYPASLSAKVHDLLRSEMGFEGVIITDDLIMEGLTAYVEDAGEAAVMAVAAGNDLLITSEVEGPIAAIQGALESGQLTVEQVDTAVRRVLLMKMQLGLVE